MLQLFIVGLIVTASTVYAAWQLASPSQRLRAVVAYEKRFGVSGVSNRLRQRALAAMAGCSSCEAKPKLQVKTPGAGSTP